MTKIAIALTATVVVAVLGFQQLEIQYIGDQVADTNADIKEIKELIVRSTSEKDMISWTPAEETCLAKNIYHEAGVEPRAGKFAVAQVTLNRLHTRKWGNDLCSVVYAKAQFSWTLVAKRRTEVPKGPIWEESKAVAHAVLHQSMRMPALRNVQYYHADWIADPKWTKTVVKNTQIGQHIFYDKI